jgi:hypothetical protein
VELSTAEEDAIWERFEAAFGWFDSEIREPTPSLTWDTRWVYDGEAELHLFEVDLNSKALRALQSATSPGEQVYALDWMHTCFWFDPRGGIANGDPDEWAIPVLPNGDHYLFLAPDLRFGLIGIMDTSLCVFGEQLLAALATDPPTVFGRLLRQDGQPI